MKAVKLSVAIIGLVWIWLIWHFTLNATSLDNQDMQIKKGDVYLYSHDWNNPDPFQEKEIDTVVVMDIKEDYVKWSYGNKGHYLHGEIRFFKHNIRAISKN